MGRRYNFVDLTGVRFGRLLVVRDGWFEGCGDAKWECLCDCGRTTHLVGSLLKRGVVKSCGCIRDERMTTHGQSKTRLYKMWVAIRHRCQRDKREFDLDPGDLKIPEFCPVFGVRLETDGPRSEYMASVDRIDNSKGYVKGNIAIISLRANKLKNNASIEELEAIVVWMKAMGAR